MVDARTTDLARTPGQGLGHGQGPGDRSGAETVGGGLTAETGGPGGGDLRDVIEVGDRLPVAVEGIGTPVG